MGKTIRVPSTTVLFIHVLERILREHFELKIASPECWTFQHVGKWEVCGSPGACPIHGVSQDAYDHADRAALEAYPDDDHSRWHYAEMFYVPCYEHRFNAYVGVGKVKVLGDNRFEYLDLRVVIKSQYWFALPTDATLYDIDMWVCDANNSVRRGSFSRDWDGNFSVSDRYTPDLPPTRISFHREIEEKVAAPSE